MADRKKWKNSSTGQSPQWAVVPMEEEEEVCNIHFFRDTTVSIDSYRHVKKLTYLLTPCYRVPLEQLNGLQLVKKFPAFHGTRRFITVLTSVHHLSLSWTSPIQSIYPHPSILILSTHLRLGLPSSLFPSGFPTQTLHTPLSSPIGATCSAHLILLDFITRTILGEEYKSFSSSLCNLLHSPFTSSLLGSNILLNTMFGNGWTPPRPFHLNSWKEPR